MRQSRGGAANTSDIGVVDDVLSHSVRPTLDKLEGKLEPLHQLFHDSQGFSFLKIHEEVNSSGLFDKELWERTKQSHVARPGFKLQDQQPVELRRELRLSHYVGRGRQGFSVKLSVIWKLGAEYFSFEVDGKAIESMRRRIPYSESESHGSSIDGTVDEICKAMLDEIKRRSETRPQDRHD